MNLTVLALLLCSISGFAATYQGTDVHLQSHAESFNIDAESGDIKIETDRYGRVTKITGEQYEGSIMIIHWMSGKIDSVDLNWIPTAPGFGTLRDPAFLSYVADFIAEHSSQINNGNTQNISATSWQFFWSKEVGSLEKSYSSEELKNIINKNFELRMRIKTLPIALLSKLGLRKISDEPFWVASERAQTLTQKEVFAILEQAPLSECEQLLKAQPLFL